MEEGAIMASPWKTSRPDVPTANPTERPWKTARRDTAPAVGQADSTSFPRPMRGPSNLTRTPPWWLQMLRSGNEALPSTLSLAGGILGATGGALTGPGAIAGIPYGAIEGTAVGATAGVPIRNVIRPLLGYHTPRQSPIDEAVTVGRDMAGEVLKNEAGLVGGRVLGGVTGAIGKGAMRSSLSSPQTSALTRGARDNLAKRTGLPVEPGEADLAAQAIKERVAPGARSFKIEVRRLQDKVREFAGWADQNGHTAEIDDLLGPLKKLRNELGLRTDGAAAQAQFDNEVQALRELHTTKGAYGSDPRFNDLPAGMVQQLKDKWQDQAQIIFDRERAAAANPLVGRPTEQELISARVAQSAAQGAREWLEGLPGVGPRIAKANQRIQDVMPLQTAMENATFRHMGRGAAVTSGLLGGGAGLITHGPTGAALGATTAMLAADAARTPAFSGRMGLTMTGNGTIQRLMSLGPRAIPLIQELLSSGQAYPDSTESDYPTRR